MKTLVLVFHPDMSASRANRPLAAKAEALGDDVTVRYMYDIYPDQKVDVAAEQAALEAADRVVLQFPMYWYSTPALLKQWLDDVLLYGWAYGSTGKALAGKELLVAVSTGGPGDAYSHESSYGYTLTELLRPLQATANMVQMTYLEPFTTTGTLTITDEALAGKELLVAVSTGGPGDAYSHESSYGYTLTELLRPLQATANMVQMTYLEPFTTTGTLTITDEALAQRAEDYAATLQSTDLPVLDRRG